MPQPLVSRRRFLATTAVGLAVAPWVTSGLRAASPNGKLRHASIGVGGMGESDLESLASHPMIEIVALCDVDSNNLAAASQLFPKATCYRDWRELLEREADRIDSVNVATPDHLHGSVGLEAMSLGKHLYGQKPLAQNLFECRQMMLRAREKKVVTQMGIQVSAGRNERLAVALIRQGAIGKVKEVHSWSYKKWGDMEPVPSPTDEVTKELDWNLWLGPAAERPFINGYYHPQEWRKRRDFGTGTLGDMGCHMFSAWFRALELAAPIEVCSKGPAPLNATSWAINGWVEYTFKGTAHTAAGTVKVTWYDGDSQLPAEVIAAAGGRISKEGSIFLGTDGVMLFPHGGAPLLVPKEKFKNYPMPEVQAVDHYHEFIDCCLKGDFKTGANFDIAAPLTEAVLLGCLSSPFPGEVLRWDAPGLKISNHELANKLVKRDYRTGWELPSA
ncbi:MAG: Gfo/Idh/MocA family oxidoreductase [Akkermansiaceae bacterium]|nr:Gfo/Idh/MocA family oxidoreductase [Akkermansiaceae bacterium]